ncbi:uracil-DNA glycosylase [Ensifer soli]|uniref:uracil-DNA glycosylase n=1 Tax=Ciceribacter sp. sgz301302 TaxID=3342379 RepID=UPI0035B884E7
MIPADALSPRELAALLQFYADAGVEWPVENQPLDRFAEFRARSERLDTASPPADPSPAPARPAVKAAPARPAERAAPARPTVAIPDEQAIADALAAASGAETLDALRQALEAFAGCNLRMSARSTLFLSGDPAARVMVVGPMPYSDDEREGAPFSGLHGEMLDRMLGAIGLQRQDLALSTAVPWRPPGNRMPTARESDICRPFIERQIALVAPRRLLLLGNFTARFFFGGSETIHDARGRWRAVAIGGRDIPAMATLHPQELLSAPASKRLAWQDLLAFRAGMLSEI